MKNYENLVEYIKHSRHFDGLGMGDQDLEYRAQKLQDYIDKLELIAVPLDDRVKEILAYHDDMTIVEIARLMQNRIAALESENELLQKQAAADRIAWDSMYEAAGYPLDYEIETELDDDECE